MKIALAQINVHIGNFNSNTNKFIECIQKAKAEHADIIVFPELAVCGYPARDFLDYRSFVKQCEAQIEILLPHCKDIACIIGSPSFNPKIEGKDLFNSAYFLNDSKIQKIIHKTLLPTYDIFDEYRHFEPNTFFECIDFKGKKIALTICEDLWNIEDNPLYVVCPMDKLMRQNPDMMINIAASPFDYLHEQKRKTMLCKNVSKYNIPLVYVNHISSQTELIFDGGSMVINASQKIVHELAYFQEELRVVDMDTLDESNIQQPKPEIEKIHDALILGIKDYFHKSGFTKAVLGLSGGIDSAVVCVLAAKALGAKNVLAVLMPSQYSSDHSINDAERLVKNLGTQSEIVPIKEIMQQYLLSLKPMFLEMKEDLTEENMQARIRGVILMAFSNKFGNILLNTSNKSEAAVGYGTLYGDMCGGLSVIGDVYKTKVYELAHFINREREIIPVNTITKAPSAELRPNQKDSDSLPDYAILDLVLFHYIEKQLSANEIIAEGFDEGLVNKIVTMVNRNEHKRYQTAPTLRVSPKAFGMGRRMPIVAKYL